MLRRSSSSPASLWIAMLTVAAAALGFWYVYTDQHLEAILVCSLAHTFLGLSVFLTHGGRALTPSGIYFLASTIFVALAAIATVNYSPRSADGALAMVCAGSLTANGIVFAFVRKTSGLDYTVNAPVSISRAVVSFIGWIGFAMVISCTVMFAVLPALKPIAAGGAYAGVVLVLIVLVDRWRADSLFNNPLWVAMMGLAIIIFVSGFFSGGGRLNLATLAISAGFLVSVLRPRSWYKPMALLAVVPAVLLGGIHRARRFTDGDIQIDQLIADGAGMASVWRPINIFADVLRVREASPGWIPLQWGSTFWEALIAPVPRAFWPTKPEGLGMRLTRWLMNDAYAERGHSLAATAYGEWVLNFGWVGFLLGAVFTGLVLVWMDRRWCRSVYRHRLGAQSMMLLAVWTMLIVGIADYVWVGFFTYNTRAGFRAFTLLSVIWGLRLLFPHVLTSYRSRRRLSPRPVA